MLTEALLLNGVVALAVFRFSHPHPDPREVVTLTPVLGLALFIEMFCAAGTPPPNCQVKGSVEGLALMLVVVPDVIVKDAWTVWLASPEELNVIVHE